jgi:hypothetical protein
MNLYIGPDQARPQLRQSRNDGGLVLSGQNYQGNIPLVSFEVSFATILLSGDRVLINPKSKRRHAGGVHRYTRTPEIFNPKTLAQEVAELLGKALAEFRAVGSKKGDQESYLITIHGTQMRVVAAYFTKDYLRYVQSNELPVDQHLHVRRSRYFELKDPEGRVDALKLVFGVFRYIMSGRAAMEQTRQVSASLRKFYR